MRARIYLKLATMFLNLSTLCIRVGQWGNDMSGNMNNHARGMTDRARRLIEGDKP